MLGIAAFPGDSTPRHVDLPEPGRPGPGEVLCRTLELGVCGTDREILHSHQPGVPAGEKYLVLGHECLGQVEEVGPGVTEFRAGDLVVPTVRRATSQASIRIDLLALGQFTERGIIGQHGFSVPYWIETVRYLYRVADALRSLAVFTEPLAVAEKGIHEALAVQQARLGPDAWSDQPPRVLVTGLGPIGFAAALACVCRGWPVTIYGRDAETSFRAGLAVQLGAEYLSERRAGFGSLDAEDHGYDLALECTGSDEVMVRATRALAARGVMVWLGSTRRPQPLPLNVAQMMRDGLLRNHIHIGSVNAAPRDFQAALRDLASLRATHGERIESLFTARLAPRNSLWHFEHRAEQGIKSILDF